MGKKEEIRDVMAVHTHFPRRFFSCERGKGHQEPCVGAHKNLGVVLAERRKAAKKGGFYLAMVASILQFMALISTCMWWEFSFIIMLGDLEVCIMPELGFISFKVALKYT